MKDIFKNILKAIGVMLYFIALNMAYTRMNLERLVRDIEFFSGVFLVLGILLLEKSYKEDNEKIAITSIESLFLSLHSLSIMHIIKLFKYDFQIYLLSSSYIIAIYYVLKSIIIYTIEKRNTLDNLSDISEIVNNNEPIKKEAKKRNERQELKQDNKSEKKTTKTKKGARKK